MKAPQKYTSIVMTHFAMNAERSYFMRNSIQSLIETVCDLPVEITVVDNGDNQEDSKFFLDLCFQNRIQAYVRNSINLHFGMARNQGVSMSFGNYICIVDNDLFYKPGWLQACLAVLEKYPEEKIYSTPIEYPTGMLKERYDKGKIHCNGLEYNLNMRAGSNCFVARRNDFYEIGEFLPHRIAGTKWTDNAVRKGYLAAVVPGGLVGDMGLRRGYKLSEAIPIRRILANGEVAWFNQDEYEY